jgi:DNA-binding transcriptional ArsR family regulator
MSIAGITSGERTTRQAITKHLLVLESAGLVKGSRRGRERLWQLDPAQLEAARRYLDRVSKQWDEALERLRTSVEE